ncbi:aspartic peptidase A1 [Infundibulicybe gibba]|nr:aspartic peptidase A1 [Infundibulicybe gibba]
MHSFSLSLLLSLFVLVPVHCVRLSFHARVTSTPPQARGLSRRASPVPIFNNGNVQYVSNITLGGIDVPVLLDTGSSDLWAHFPAQLPQSTDMGKSLTLAYAVGKATGNIHSATLEFDNYTVPDLPFVLVTDTSTFSANFNDQGYSGLIGFGPNSGSLIRKKLDKGDAGNTMLSRIFEQDRTTGNYISLLLDRKGDPSDLFTGQMTVSEIVPGFENITSMPKLDVDTVSKLLKAEQHWQALTDKNNGIIGPDGQAIKIKSIVPRAPSGQLVAVFDSGFTFSQVPRDVADAIYGRARGAIYDTEQELWTLPCGQVLNLTFNFGGLPYPVHPLDVVDDNFSKTDANGNKICIGSFQPITTAFSMLGNYDMIMGMNFLRNVYTLLDFGNWVDTSSTDRGHPYIQIASLTDTNQAHKDFVKIRLGGVDTSGDAKWSLLAQNETQHSPVSAEEKKKKYQEMILSRWPYILLGCLAFLMILLGLCIWKCCCRKGSKRGCCRKNPRTPKKEKGWGKMESSTDLPLHEPPRAYVGDRNTIVRY